MDARTRQASASASVYSEDNSRMNRHAGSHSATPAGEDDGEDMPKRSTRGRNPLPPTVGPLFPPLPPKQPKPRSSVPRSQQSEPVDIDTPADEAEGDPLPLKDKLLGDLAAESPSGSRPDLPSGSATSLTPPPPTSEDAGIDQDGPSDGDDGVDSGSISWDEAGKTLGDELNRNDTTSVKREQVDALEVVEDLSTPKRNGGRGQAHDADAEPTPPAVERTDSAGRLARKRRGEEQLLLDDHLLPEEMRRGAALASKRKNEVKNEEEEEEEEEGGGGAAEGEEEEGEEEEGGDEGRVRCVCKTEDPDIMMIQCDKCLVWQHGPCMGIWNDDEAPDEYYCDECRPDLHGPLRKYIRSLGRNPQNYVTPTPADMEKNHYPTDKNPPSQSKRWKQPNQLRPPKPLPISRNRKEAASPVESTEGKRSTRDRDRHNASAQPVPSSSRNPPVSNSKSSLPAKAPDQKKKVEAQTTVKKTISIKSPSPTASPPPHGQPHKRRSTMNSRDAAYEEQVKAALEASRRENATPEVVTEDAVHESEADKHVAVEEESEEKVSARKAKRKRDDEDAVSDAGAHPPLGKPKHPNQYTYRPKPSTGLQSAAAASPARRVAQGATPVPSLPPPAQHEHGTRRAGAIANGIIPPPPNSVSVHNLHWHLPDHLSAFADLLPGSHPLPLEARAARSLAYLPRSHFLNQKYGPLTEDRDEKHRLILRNDTAPRETTGEPNTQLEPPARVRYPAKRITTAEMRKRVRSLLDYASRVQIEETRRRERANLIGIDVNTLPKAVHLDKDGNAVDPAEEDQRQEAIRPDRGRKSAQMLDELVNDLILLQEGLNGLTNHLGLGVSPMPAASSIFGSVPVSPAVPSTATVGATAGVAGTPQALTDDQPDAVGAEDHPDVDGTDEGPRSGIDLDSGAPNGDQSDEAQATSDAVKGLLGLPELDSPILPKAPAVAVENNVFRQPAGERAQAAGGDIVIEQAEVPVDVYRKGEIKDVAMEPEEMDVDVPPISTEVADALVGAVEV